MLRASAGYRPLRLPHFQTACLPLPALRCRQFHALLRVHTLTVRWLRVTLYRDALHPHCNTSPGGAAMWLASTIDTEVHSR
jgi:hypothetical protein